MHEGAWSSRLGIAGQPALAEEAMLARDLALVRADRRADALPPPVDRRRRSSWSAAAKADGLPVTAEVTPHHLSLCRRRGRELRPGLQGQPAAADRARRRGACGPALPSGAIDAIATDHAPHAPERKDEPFDEAPRA